MKIRKNSWHYRLLRQENKLPQPLNLCPYVRALFAELFQYAFATVVGLTLIVGALGSMAVAAFSLFGGFGILQSLTDVINWESVVAFGALLWIFVIAFGLVAGVWFVGNYLNIGEKWRAMKLRRADRWREYHNQRLQAKLEKSKAVENDDSLWALLREYGRAIHNKVCPMLEVEE